MIKEFIEKIPKAELLVHIEGTLEPELRLQLAKRNNIKLPFASVDEIKKSYQWQNLQEFLKIYYTGLEVLQTEQDFYDLTYAYLKKCAQQNVRHTEISFDPQAHLKRGIAFVTVVTGIFRATQAAQKEFNLSSQLIMCILRDMSAEDARQILLKGYEFKDWIVAIGLDSAEKNNPPDKFSEVFALAREYGFFVVAAAGEEGPPEYIWQALDDLQVSRIGYAVRCMEDADLVNRLIMTATPLSICPISNVKLGVVKSLRQHPLKRMLEQGLCVTINSDNPAYFNAYLTDNFLAASEALKFNKKQIYELVKNSFMASFLDHEKKLKLIQELDKYFNSFTG
jgi:adenine deaminase